MPSILFITENSDSPSTRYRALNYFNHLRQIGWKTSHLPATTGLRNRLALLRQAKHADVVVIVRKTFTQPFRALLRQAAKRLVLDLDDAIFVKDDGSPSRTRAARFASMAGLCDAVWAGNDYLAQESARYNTNVTVLPTSINTRLCQSTNPTPSRNIDLVWIGSASTRKYLLPLVEILDSSPNMTPNIRLKIIADFQARTSRLTTIPITWSQATEAHELSTSHVGLAPMPDDPWTRGKCGLKSLQYMAAALPVIASNHGVHQQIVIHNQTGFLAQSPQDWIDDVLKLAANPDLRTALGQAGRHRLERHYSLDATFSLMHRSLEKLMSSR